jgi:hypothetical protein
MKEIRQQRILSSRFIDGIFLNPNGKDLKP